MPELHHPHSPSSYPNYANCPCYEGEPIPSMEDAPTHPANAGTRVHKFISDTLEGSAVVIADPEEQVWTERGVDYAHKLMNDRSAECEPPLIETRLTVELGFKVITWGTTDLLLPPDPLGSCCPIAVDWKTTRERSDYYAQACCYALGAMQMYGSDVCEFHMRYLRFAEVDPADDIWHITKEEATKVVFEIFAKIDVENPVPTPHEDTCKYCRKKTTCEPVGAMAVDVARHYEPKMLADLEEQLNEYHPSKITEPATMVVAKRVRDVLEKWCASVQRSATDMASELEKKGSALPGYKLIQPSPAENVSRIVACFKASKLTEGEFLECCSVSIPDLRTKCGDAEELPKTGPKRKKHLQSLMGGLLVQSPKNPYLRKVKGK